MTALLLKGALALAAFLLASRPLLSARPKKLLAAESSMIRQAAEAGDLEARYRLAWALENGYGEELNLLEAATWYSLAAEAGHYKSAEKLEELIKSEAFQEALRLKKEAEIAPGDTLADMLLLKEDLEALGTLSLKVVNLVIVDFVGRGLKACGDPVLAEDFLRGVLMGDPLCQFTAGVMCAKGELGVRDKGSVLRWFGRAANGGYQSAGLIFAAMVGIGYNGVKRDLKDARRFLKDAADGGESWAAALLWRLRKAAPELFSEDEAFDYLVKAVQSGICYSEYDMAMGMLSDPHNEAIHQQALELLNISADKGHAPAKKYLAKHFPGR
jgi:hypothetical protein